jgi:hypothetical protein
MTPYSHHTSDSYIVAYQSELTRDLSAAHRGEALPRTLRKGVGRALVRFGAWMMPDKPELVSETILILPKKQSDSSTIRSAA